MEAGLLHSSSDDSFEYIDPDFDNTYYQELQGIAIADYIPLEKDEIMLRKGLKKHVYGAILLHHTAHNAVGARSFLVCYSAASLNTKVTKNGLL